MGWIEWIRRRTATVQNRDAFPGALQLGIGDDCAVLRPLPGEDIVVTTDFTLEGRHFRRDWHPPEAAGHRTLARGLSDLAAMGARPLAAFLSLALPAADARQPAWAEQFLGGLLALAERFAVPLAGGDTSEAPGEGLLADIVLLGAVPAGTALRRSGAWPGDALYVTGSLGGAAAELQRLAASISAGQPVSPGAPASATQAGGRHPQLYPEPRIAAGQQLQSAGLATACMDLSDGLSSDLAQLCKASGVDAIVVAEWLPASSLLGSLGAGQRESLMLHGGEDYELLFTARPETPIPDQIAEVPVTRIGSIVPQAGAEARVGLRRGAGEELLLPGGWEHLHG